MEERGRKDRQRNQSGGSKKTKNKKAGKREKERKRECIRELA